MFVILFGLSLQSILNFTIHSYNEVESCRQGLEFLGGDRLADRGAHRQCVPR